MKRFYLALIVSITTAGLHGQTLDDYLSEAAQNNPGLKASYSSFEAAIKHISQVNVLPDPNLSFGYFVSPVETRVGAQRAKISLNQMFPWFGTLKLKEEVAQRNVDIYYQQFLDHKNQLFFQVKESFYPLYKVKAHLRLQEENLQILETYRQLSTTNFANGKGPMTDVLRVEILIENIETEMSLLTAQVRPLEIKFNRLLNREDSMKVFIADTLSISLIDSLKSDSVGVNHPKVAAIKSKLQMLQAQEVVVQKSGFPQMGLGLDYVFINKRPDLDMTNNGKDAIMPMISMTLPVFRRKYTSALEENRLLQQSISYQMEQVENNLMSEYESIGYEIDKTSQLDELYENQLQKSKRVLSLLYAAYSNSGKDFEEILRVQQQILKYEMAQVSVRADHHIALARLAYLTAKSELDGRTK
ncbi:MAG: TolC family protein [Cyclobacteriaceae bacterium]